MVDEENVAINGQGLLGLLGKINLEDLIEKANNIDKITADSNKQIEVAVKKIVQDELGAMKNAFNRLTSTLELNFKKLFERMK